MPTTYRHTTRGEEALVKLIKAEAAKIAGLETALKFHRSQRNKMILKARHAGFTVREVEAFAGISNVEVSRISRTKSVSEGE